MTGDLPRVGVLHAPQGAASLRDIFVAARGRFEVVVILRPSIVSAQPDLVTAAATLFEVVVGEPTAELLRPLELNGLTSFHDSELDPLDAALAELGLPGLPADRAWDKLRQRQLLNKAGASHLPVAEVSTPDDLHAAIASIGMPGVLKPRRGVGGLGVAFITGPEDVNHQLDHRTQWTGLLYEQMLAQGRHPAGVDWLADFVSVETLSLGNGARRHLAIFDKAPVSVARRAGAGGADAVRVTGDITPTRLPAAAQAAVLSCVDRALSALEVTWRVTHTELWLDGEDVQVIEVNGRVGGHLNRLLRLLNGPDLVAAALGAAVGLEYEPARPQPGFAAGLFPAFLSGGATVLSQVSRSDVRGLPGVVGVDEIAEPGAARADSAFRVANVTLRAPSGDELDACCAAYHAGLARLYAADGPVSSPWSLR